MALNGSLLRRLRICSRDSALSVARAESSEARTCLACSAAPLPLAIITRATNANTPRNTTTMIAPISIDPPFYSVDRRLALKQARRQNDARDAEPIKEPGTNMGRLIYANHLAIGSDPLLDE